jgi:hypothetical protein
MILDHKDRNKRYFLSNANPVRINLVIIWFLSGIGDVPTPLSGIATSMLLTCRLKITFI